MKMDAPAKLDGLTGRLSNWSTILKLPEPTRCWRSGESRPCLLPSVSLRRQLRAAHGEADYLIIQDADA